MSRNGKQWRSAILGGTSNGNRLVGRVYRGDKFWVAKVPALDVITQGRWKHDAYAMVADMLKALVNLPGFSVCVKRDEGCGFEVTSKNPSHWGPAWNRN